MKEKKTASYGEGKEIETEEDKLFEVYRTPLFCTRTFCHCQQNTQGKRQYHASLVEETIHFLPKGASFSDAIEKRDYDAPGEVSSTHGAWKDLISNIPRFPQEKRVHKKKRRESSFKIFMRPEQKSTAMVRDIIQKLTRPRSLVVDAFFLELFLTQRLACFSFSIGGS